MDRKTLFQNETTVSKKDFEDLFSKIKGEVTIGHKLKPLHLECKGSDRQNVRLACELISQTVSKMFRHFFPRDRAKKALADLIEQADMTFNLMTAEGLGNSDVTRNALGGENFNEQLEILLKFSNLISNTKFFGKIRFNKVE